MANGGDLRPTAAGSSIEQESPVVLPPPPREIPTANIPPARSTAPNTVNLTEENQSLVNSLRYYTALTHQERETFMQSLFNLMTSNEEDGAAQFREVVSRSDLPMMGLLLTSDLDRFLEMARNKNGSNRIQELLGITDDLDIFFFNAITRRFVNFMTDYEASRVGTQGMQVFNQERQKTMYDYVLDNAIHLACNRTGYAVLKKIIDGLGHLFYRDRLLDIVAQNALRLSYHAHGNYVVQHVLRLNDLRCTHNVGVSLSDRCFGLSFTKSGSHVVEAAAAVMVVEELLRRDEESLVRLARSEYGNYVVLKALRVMRESRNRMYLFWRLANKFRPYVHLLRGRNVGEYLYWLR
ncbi:PREDICTED: putative pumilio homolog 19 [Brassica oleracea var. oleracea]|uniref:PUM-HD domain-containing protein n=1 Tax=Brassica oleracea var. oleracea TaxID=109376 RepID=A0A0D3B2L3_BRAOL|nr:PREDICTED: putative pumilio homolog 19 [Brassica oleracea var. oleracea]